MTEEERREAARQRTARYRERLRLRKEAHDRGDHSQCRTDQCEAAWSAARAAVDLDAEGLNEADGDTGEGVTRDVTPAPKNSASHREPPAGLRDRGLRLWREMSGLKLGPTHVLLLERACRLADRLQRLDELLEGGDWLDTAAKHADPDEGVVEVRVVVDRALGETRQHEIALKLLVAELRHAGRPATAAGGTPPTAGDHPPAPEVKEGAASGNVTSIAAIRGSAGG